MFKKTVILTFCALFLLSTTGLPLTLHFCKMKSETVKCKMCTAQHETHSNGPVFKRDMSGCCKTTTIKTEVKDNFISAKADDISVYKNITTVFFDLSITNNYRTYFKLTDKSPPLKDAGTIYLSNSVLLI